MSIPARSRGELDVAVQTSRVAARFEQPVVEFIHTEGASGFLLICAAIAAMAWANSPWANSYFRFWEATVSFDFGPLHLSKSLHHWINDGLMAIFFFLVGMEIKHEFVRGQLSTFRRAALPVLAAVGGMIAPALLYLAFNINGAARGWGVPMATDIAFALAVLAIVPGVPVGLKVFLLALAIADDLGAILLIALFYTPELKLGPLAVAVLLLALVFAFRSAGVRLAFPYVILGIAVWVCVLKSGVHATVSGVALAFAVSSRSSIESKNFAPAVLSLLDRLKSALARDDHESAETALGAIETLSSATEPPLERITRQLHAWVSYLILPLFALANAGVALDTDALHTIADPIAIGIAVGLFFGKPLGIVAFSWLAVRFGFAELPRGIRWGQILGSGILAGIGFTVAIFIASLVFDTNAQLRSAKLAILGTSIVAGMVGYAWLRWDAYRRATT